MTRGIYLRGKDEVIESRAKAAGLKVVVGDALDVPFERTLIVEPGTRVPWDLLPAAWSFLLRWDAAVPLWRYGVLAQDVGTAAEREATRAVVRDLRVLVHATELLFVRQSEGGCALVEAWRAELAGGGDRQLAFLRAYYRVKPRLCVLPVTWLAEVRAASSQAMRRRSGARSPNAANPLVKVELEPGRFVKCHAGDEARVREAFERQHGRGR